MKKLAWLILVVTIAILPCHAQTTNAVGTILDPTGKPYVNAPVTANFINPSNVVANWNNSPMTATTWSTNADSAGHFSMVLPDLNFIGPATGTYYAFRICQNNSGQSGQPINPCFTYTSPACPTVGCISGSSIDLTAAIQAVSLPLPTGGGPGTITAVNTTVGSGLSGGGTAGNLNIILGPCSVPNQVEQWNGSAWVCSLISGTVPTAPPSSPLVSQGVGTAPVYAAGITYVTTAMNWSQILSAFLTGGAPSSVTLTPCPVGVDYTSGAGYQVYIADGSNSEAVSVTSGATVGPNCSINFTPFFSHSNYTIGSASSGIQETINIACGVASQAGPGYNAQCNVTIPANGLSLSPGTWSLNNYNVYGTIFFHSNQSILDGNGVSLRCTTRGPCLQMGDLLTALNYQNNTVKGLSFSSPTNFSSNSAYNGVNICNTSATSGYATITTCSAHNFRPGDLVAIQFTDNTQFWGDALVTDCGSGVVAAACTGSSTTFRYLHPTAVSSVASPGIVALGYEAILDNSQNSHFVDIQYDNAGEVGHFNHFFDMWDDENATIEHFSNNAINLNRNQNWTGAFVWSGGSSNIGHTLAPVITLRDSNITANGSNGVTALTSNGVYLDNTVIQAQGLWQAKVTNEAGGYQGAALKNTYSESSIVVNQLSPAWSPFNGIGSAGMIFGVSSSAASYQIQGTPPTGLIPSTCGTGTTPLTYYIVAKDTTLNKQTSPMRILDCLTQTGDNPQVRWPRIARSADSFTYDVIRMTTPVNIGDTVPSYGNCPGGAGGICGSVATGITQNMACGNTLICTYTDTGIPSTSAYTVLQGNYGQNGQVDGGQINYWPGSLVTVNKTVKVDVEAGPAIGVGLTNQPSQSALVCGGVSSPGGYSICQAGIPFANQVGTLLMDGPFNSSGGWALTKGRLNFGTTPYTVLQPHHIITLVDSNPGLTAGTIGYRPPASANDVWIGTDVAAGGVALNLGKLAFGAPVSISHYIGNTGDNTSWLERLTSSLKEFNVATQFDLGFTMPGATLGQSLVFDGTKFINSTPGIPFDSQTGTSYIIPSSDNVKFVTGNNSSPTAWTGPALSLNRVFSLENLGTGLITYTPVAGTVNGAANQIVPQNYFGFDYTNNSIEIMPLMPTIKAFPNTSTNQSLTFNSATGTFGTTQGPQVKILSSDYTTNSTVFSDVTGLSFPETASGVYKIVCDLTWQALTGSDGIQLSNSQAVPATKTTVNMTATTTKGVGASFYSDAYDNANGGLILGAGSIGSLAVDLPAQITFNIINGVNAGTWQLRSALKTSGTMTIKAGSACVMFTQ